jgi:hypothetical protein
MTVTEYTVSDAEGNTAESKFIGTIVGVPGNPFVFYVRNPGTPGQPLEVQIVMPLGGTESGLFRFPRVGEQVLVGTETASGTNLHYLMGYIPIKTPSSQNFQTAGMFQDDGRGEVFRYRQTGKRKAPPGEKYSEIGFYHKQTAWRAAKGEQSNYADNQDATGAYVYPKIDRINIHSTGDIHESAVNHHRVQAKRFELLVDAEGKDGRPLGDNPGDDSGLHAGDVHIRAGNRVVLKAGDEIILQVGKTVLKINDDGLDIASKVINSNVSNPYDATVSINRGGISLFGFAVTINSIKSFDIGDAFSGGLASNLGIVSLGGREIKADAYDSAEFKAVVIGALQQHALSIKAGVEGLTGLSALDMLMLPFTEPDKKPDTAESDTSADDANSKTPADDANSKAPDDTGIVTPELNAPKEEEISSSANALDIGIFVLTYGNDVFNMVKRVYKFIQKIVGLSKQFAEITQKLVFERKKEAEEAKKKAVDDAKKAKEEAVKGAEEAKKKALDDAKKAKEEAVRQAKQDMAMGNITKEEMEKRIADANEKEKKETEYRTRVAKLATADAELREARIVAEATAKEADAIAKAESLQAKKDAELSRKQAEEKNEAARKAALEKEKQDKAQADQTKAERIRKAEDDFLKDTENGMSKEDALAKMNNEKKQAAADANKEKQKATEERWETTKKEYAHTEEEKKEADNKEKQKKAEIEETRKKTQKDVEEKKREEETKWQNAHKF